MSTVDGKALGNEICRENGALSFKVLPNVRSKKTILNSAIHKNAISGNLFIEKKVSQPDLNRNSMTSTWEQ